MSFATGVASFCSRDRRVARSLLSEEKDAPIIEVIRSEHLSEHFATLFGWLRINLPDYPRKMIDLNPKNTNIGFRNVRDIVWVVYNIPFSVSDASYLFQ